MMSIEQEIYRSYLAAKPSFALDPSDSHRRNPEYLSAFFQKYSADGRILVTGSKGKGSLARLVAGLLSVDHRTGLFISPHIEHFCERISINGEMISEEELTRIVYGVLADLKTVESRLKKGEYISPVGILALAAMRYFTEYRTELQVLECGRGAKYDEVNQIPHTIAVIGTVFLEHTRELGGTIEEIAYNKAHVITGDTTCCYIMDQDPVVCEVIRERARRCGVRLKEYGRDFWSDHIRCGQAGKTVFDIHAGGIVFPDVTIPLAGRFQAKHAALAVACYADLAQEKGWQPPGPDFLRQAWSNLSIPGRMELLQKDPFVFMDSTINRKSAVELMAVLDDMGIERAVFLLCIPDGKDVTGVAETIQPKAGRIILSKIIHPHYPMKQDQIQLLRERGIACENENDFKNAFHKALISGWPIIVLVANTFVKDAKKMMGVLIDIT